MKRVAMILSINLLLTTISYAGNGDLSVSGKLSVGSTPSAVVDIPSPATPKKGFLPPRMSTADRSTISSPAAGLLIYNTTENAYDYYTGTSWIALPNYSTDAGNGEPGTIPVRSPAQGFLNVIYETTLASDQPNVTITGLNGDSDIWWELIAAIRTTVADAAVRIRYNGDYTGSNYSSNLYGVTTASNQPVLLIGDTANYGLAKQLIYAKTGSYRGNFGQSITPAATSGSRVNNGWWENTTDNITSITIIPDSGNIAAGSRIVLRRML